MWDVLQFPKYTVDFIKIFRSHSDIKTSPSGFQSHQLYPHNGRKTEGERKGNGREIDTCRRHLFRTRLGLVTESSSSTESWQNDCLPKPSTERKGNGRDLTRHRCLETRDACSPLWCHIGQAGTSLVMWFYPHNGRATEGERKGNGRTTSTRHDNPRAGLFFTINFTRITEGKRKGNGRGTEGIPKWYVPDAYVFL